jgi:galactokinase
MALNVAAVIPARYGSSRFPGKLLADKTGKPLIAHVYERVIQARRIGQVEEGIEQLRDVTPEMLAEHAHLLDEVLLKRARHVVTEDERTERAAEALKEGGYEEFGRLMNGSHESLRDDYEVSCEELDIMVEAARRQDGVLGARMVGAGFGGCTVNLVEREKAAEVAEALADAYEDETGIEPQVYEMVAAAGARVEQC